MGRRRKPKPSRSEKRTQKLYEDAIREVKERNINIDDLPAAAADNEGSSDDTSTEEKNVLQKTRKKPKQVLEETLKKQEELRKPRVSLCVPVSRLVPFKPDEKGLEFPRDFCRDSTSQYWIPRSSGKPTLQETYNGRRPPSSDFDDSEKDLVSRRESSPDNKVDEILQVFPLRVQEDDDYSCRENAARSQQLPPIYRQDLWRETMRRASEPSRSIPAKQDSWNIHTSLMVGRQELYKKEKCKSSISLAETRFRLRAASSGAVLP